MASIRELASKLSLNQGICIAAGIILLIAACLVLPGYLSGPQHQVVENKTTVVVMNKSELNSELKVIVQESLKNLTTTQSQSVASGTIASNPSQTSNKLALVLVMSRLAWNQTNKLAEEFNYDGQHWTLIKKADDDLGIIQIVDLRKVVSMLFDASYSMNNSQTANFVNLFDIFVNEQGVLSYANDKGNEWIVVAMRGDNREYWRIDGSQGKTLPEKGMRYEDIFAPNLFQRSVTPAPQVNANKPVTNNTGTTNVPANQTATPAAANETKKTVNAFSEL